LSAAVFGSIGCPILNALFAFRVEILLKPCPR